MSFLPTWMPRTAQLVITLTPDGAVTVEGPIADKPLSYALLEMARDAIKDHHDRAAQSPIAPASPRDVLALSSRKPS